MTRPNNLSKWPHLRGIEIPEVEDEEVTMLIGANVPECQAYEESRVGKAGEPYAVRTVAGVGHHRSSWDWTVKVKEDQCQLLQVWQR